jgi:hypothetical protein
MAGFMPATQDHYAAIVILGGRDKPGHDGLVSWSIQFEPSQI